MIDPNPATTNVTDINALDHSWMEFYPDAEEELPPDMP
jgi:hypothetical protein